jgi:hypothetical protein
MWVELNNGVIWKQSKELMNSISLYVDDSESNRFGESLHFSDGSNEERQHLRHSIIGAFSDFAMRPYVVLENKVLSTYLLFDQL